MAFNVHLSSISSLLPPRISPHTFAFILISSMCLSSRNRSISKAFRHILPCVAPVCEGMHYHITGVPWQMNNTFIIVASHLTYADFSEYVVRCSEIMDYFIPAYTPRSPQGTSLHTSQIYFRPPQKHPAFQAWKTVFLLPYRSGSCH